MKKRLFPLLIALSALAVSGSAAFYSVFGLSKLFAGASTQVIIMAGSLEFAKLVVASLLYQYWDTINKWLRTYLAIACFILMIITSGGIYGFLSGAYQSTATQSELLDKSLKILKQKQIRFEETKEDLDLEKTQVNKSISDLRIALSNPAQIQYIDKESGTLITTSSSSARRALQNELTLATTSRDGINIKIEAVMDSINKTDMSLLNKEVSNEAESELGPLKYLSETTGYPMNQVVNWFLLLIIFVFDPLAIALVIASNMAFSQIRKPEIDFDLDNPPNDKLKNDAEKYKEIKIEKKDIVMDDLEDLEARMNIIGQNGNDGLHYDERYLEELNQSIHKELWVEEKSQQKTPIKDPINPTQKELEKLANALNINYSEENVPLERLTDTTQTLLNVNNENRENDETDDNSRTTLKYSGRRL